MITKGLLFEYFAGNSTVLQKRMIESWLIKEENKEKYYIWLAEWEKEYPQYLPDVEFKLGDYLFQMNESNKSKISVAYKSKGKKSIKLFHFLAYAAVFILFVSLSFYILSFQKLITKEVKTNFGEIKEITLPDGSELTLYSNSRLSWSWLNFNNSRIVQLDGEANFKIKHISKATKFKVQTKNHVSIIVYGTEFRFFTRNRGSKIELNKGLIKLQYKEGEKTKTIALTPGESISLNKENKLTQRSKFNPLRNIEIKKHRFVFDNTPLSELKNLIPENFGLQIIITNKENEKLTLTGTYTGNSLNELITSLSEVTGLNIYKYHGRIYIDSY